MNIRGLVKFTLLDYPKKLACIVFVGNCNFCCSYCHNPFLVVDPESQPIITEKAFFSFLKSRIGKLDAVVISGGEPTLRSSLADFALKVKELGFLVKIDTNGSRPDVIETLFKLNCLDYVGLDYKAPEYKYKEVAGSGDNDIYKKVRESIFNILSFNMKYDIRTTVHKSILNVEDIHCMREELNSYGVVDWVLQQYHKTEVMDENLNNIETYNDAELVRIAKTLPGTRVRGLRGMLF